MKKIRKMREKILVLFLCLIVGVSFSITIPSKSMAAEVNTSKTGAQQKAMFIMENLNISQGINGSYSHQGSKAIDITGKDGGIDPAYAPFDGKVVGVSTSAAYIIYQSINQVEFADGTVDYMTIWVMHDNNVGRFSVGQTFSQGAHFFNEGSSGNATGNHIHLECAKGTYKGQYQNSNGVWCIKNQINPYDALYLSESTKIINGYGYNWRRARRASNVIPTGSKTVSDGEYHIVSALSGSSCVTVAGASKNDCANVQLWNSATPGNTNQLFTLKYLSNGNYVITSRNSKKCLDVKNGSTASGANVWQYKANNSKAQQWIVKPAGDQYFYIISALSGKYLDVSGGSSKNGTNIQVYNGNNSAAQKWKFLASGAVSGQTIKNGEYTIASALDNNVGLNIFGGKTENGANIHIWNNMKSGNLVNTIVKVKHLGNGIYTLTFKRSNKVLDIYGSHTTSGTNVHQWEYVGKDNQKWILKSAGNGYYYIIGRGSGLALDIYCGNKANGTNVWAYLKNNSNAQKWKFFAAPTLNKTSITINKGKTYKIFVKGQSATAATYSSTNKSIATVNKNGVITGKKKGTATIKVAYRGVSLSCKVTVK